MRSMTPSASSVAPSAVITLPRYINWSTHLLLCSLMQIARVQWFVRMRNLFILWFLSSVQRCLPPSNPNPFDQDLSFSQVVLHVVQSTEHEERLNNEKKISVTACNQGRLRFRLQIHPKINRTWHYESSYTALVTAFNFSELPSHLEYSSYILCWRFRMCWMVIKEPITP